MLPNEQQALGSYRRDVSKLLPKATRIAWSLKKGDIEKDQPGITKQKFLFNLSRSSYEKKWGNDYQRPTFGENVLAFLARLVPKVGPLRVLELKTPTPETEKMFEASFNAALARYKKLSADQGSGDLALKNDNFDTGSETPPGKYRLDDEAHAELLDALAKQNFQGVTPELRAEILRYYSDPEAPYSTKKNPKEWAKALSELKQLREAQPSTAPASAAAAHGAACAVCSRGNSGNSSNSVN